MKKINRKQQPVKSTILSRVIKPETSSGPTTASPNRLKRPLLDDALLLKLEERLVTGNLDIVTACDLLLIDFDTLMAHRRAGSELDADENGFDRLVYDTLRQAEARNHEKLVDEWLHSDNLTTAATRAEFCKLTKARFKKTVNVQLHFEVACIMDIVRGRVDERTFVDITADISRVLGEEAIRLIEARIQDEDT